MTLPNYDTSIYARISLARASKLPILMNLTRIRLTYDIYGDGIKVYEIQE